MSGLLQMRKCGFVRVGLGSVGTVRVRLHGPTLVGKELVYIRKQDKSAATDGSAS